MTAEVAVILALIIVLMVVWGILLMMIVNHAANVERKQASSQPTTRQRRNQPKPYIPLQQQAIQQRRKDQAANAKAASTSSRPSPQSVPLPKLQKPHPIETVSVVTQNKLLRLCNYDRETAKRLVRSISASHPDKSSQWCWEKAVFDAERDRQ